MKFLRLQVLPSSAAVYSPRLLGTSRVSASVPSTTPWNLPRVISHCPVLCCDLPPSFKLRRLARWRKATRSPVLEPLDTVTITIHIPNKFRCVFETKDSKGTAELIFSTPVPSGAYPVVGLAGTR